MWQTPESAFADELDALRLELGTSRRDVGDTERDSVAGAARELDALVLGPPDRQRDVAGLELGRLPRILRQLEHVTVEGDRPLQVARRDVDEIDTLDLHQSRGL